MDVRSKLSFVVVLPAQAHTDATTPQGLSFIVSCWANGGLLMGKFQISRKKAPTRRYQRSCARDGGSLKLQASRIHL